MRPITAAKIIRQPTEGQHVGNQIDAAMILAQFDLFTVLKLCDEMPLNELLGLDDLPEEQEIWRFLTRHKLSDLTSTGSLRLSRVSDLRMDDHRESRLPSVMCAVLRRTTSDENIREFIRTMLDACENQAFNIFASCWFLPGTPEENQKMWEEFGGSKDGGVRINSTLRRLASSIPGDPLRLFGIGRIRYIREDISYEDVSALDQYRSRPFLLKLKDKANEREIRLFERFHRPQRDWDIQPEQRPCTRFRITDTDLIESIAISRICSDQIKRDLTDELIQWGFPEARIIA